MSGISYLLDTSALLAHYFDEPGADIVQGLWTSRGPKPAISAVSIAELRGRLDDEGTDADEAARAADDYFGELTTCLSVDRAVAEMAWQLRALTPQRLPLVDALIAATARVAGATLVHKDPHMSRIPTQVVKQLVLP
jgi:predicted nucleic acid-binding protein